MHQMDIGSNPRADQCTDVQPINVRYCKYAELGFAQIYGKSGRLTGLKAYVNKLRLCTW